MHGRLRRAQKPAGCGRGDLAAGNRADLRHPPAARVVPHPGRQHWQHITATLRPVYTAPTKATARDRFDEFAHTWNTRHPAIIKLWDQARAESVPLLQFDTEIRKVVCSTNAIESVNAHIAAQYRPKATSRTRQPRSNTSTSRRWPRTRPATPTNAASPAGNPPRTPPRSPTKDTPHKPQAILTNRLTTPAAQAHLPAPAAATHTP
ncbi:transposase [Catellatospora aurea]|uniref:Mutator family transposase n=1 Tax=Catellatospora aurea TaxID=1337874 RepID=A0ABW2GRR5_9ACTN